MNSETLEEAEILRNKIEENAKRLQMAANIVAKIDVLCSLAQVAEDMNYCIQRLSYTCWARLLLLISPQ